MPMEFTQNKYDPNTKKIVQKKITPRAKIIDLGAGLLTKTKDISKSTVDIVKRTIYRGK